MPNSLGIDYGDVRIGIAISDPLGLTAQPYCIVKNSSSAITEIIGIIHKESINKVIVGLPKNQHGDDSKKAKDVRRFVDCLKQDVKIDVELVDERFSTVAAERHLITMDVSRKRRKSVIDVQAAMFILQGVLDRK